ncbi:hypothetical protein [Helicobacter sp. 13S00477-4]|uniref:hypothetical protein n=1 Tax=Helicobacter sp. 13S00477-4 TaxID=1905759 RepID=UPI000BA74211|nr:hypothetical protein [Helicobacter sp. 13S00477-4]PAF52590.1 hypothetical protein BKH44_02105 [Helicobacter sp. 13S00477-4]
MKYFKKHFLLSSAILTLAIYGCTAPQTPSINYEAQKCPAPLAEIHLDSINVEQNDLEIPTEFIQNLLKQNLKDNCLTFTNKQGNDIYDLKITYKTSLQSSSEQKIASSKAQNQLNSEVNLSLKNQKITKNFGGKSSTQVSGKKILDIGQDASIKEEDKNKSIEQAFRAAYQSLIESFK